MTRQYPDQDRNQEVVQDRERQPEDRDPREDQEQGHWFIHQMVVVW